MMEVTRSRVITASPDSVWRLVSSVERLPEWLVLADAAETVEGSGRGRLQRLRHRRGGRWKEVEQMVTAWQPPRLLEWEDRAEPGGDGSASPADPPCFSVRLEPERPGTRVTLQLRRSLASDLQGLLLRAVGPGRLERALAESLEKLDSIVAGTAA